MKREIVAATFARARRYRSWRASTTSMQPSVQLAPALSRGVRDVVWPIGTATRAGDDHGAGRLRCCTASFSHGRRSRSSSAAPTASGSDRASMLARILDVLRRRGAVLDGCALMAVLPHAGWDTGGRQRLGNCLHGARWCGTAQHGQLLFDRRQLRLGVAAYFHLPGSGALNGGDCGTHCRVRSQPAEGDKADPADSEDGRNSQCPATPKGATPTSSIPLATSKTGPTA